MLWSAGTTCGTIRSCACNSFLRWSVLTDSGDDHGLGAALHLDAFACVGMELVEHQAGGQLRLIQLLGASVRHESGTGLPASC